MVFLVRPLQQLKLCCRLQSGASSNRRQGLEPAKVCRSPGLALALARACALATLCRPSGISRCVCAARKPAVPKTSALGRDCCRTTSRSPDGRSTSRTDRSNGSLAVRLDGAGGVGMVLVANDRWVPHHQHPSAHRALLAKRSRCQTEWAQYSGLRESVTVQPATSMQATCVQLRSGC